MPKTEVFTDIYLLSHLEHESHKERWFARIAQITVWTVWTRFPRHATDPPPVSTHPPRDFATPTQARDEFLGFDDDGCAWPKFCLKSIWPRWQQAVVRFNGAYVANFLNQTCHRRERALTGWITL